MAIPDPDMSIAPAGDRAPIGGKAEGQHAAMAVDLFDLGAVDHFPPCQAAVLTACRQQIGIGPPGQAGDHFFVGAEGLKLVAGVRFPNIQAAIPVSGGQKDAVRAKRKGRHPVGVFFDISQQGGSAGIVDPNAPTGPSHGDF